ncbi:hypothetical protein ACFX11_028299 [Malus domestica]
MGSRVRPYSRNPGASPIVIDGGSTGCRIHVFGYRVNGGNDAVFDFEKDGLVSMRVNHGLSAYSKDPESAGVLLQELVESGKGRISNEHWVDSEAELSKIPYEKFDTSEEVCEQPNKSSSSFHHKNSNRGGNINGVTNGDSGNNDLLLARCRANCDTTSTPLWRNGSRGPNEVILLTISTTSLRLPTLRLEPPSPSNRRGLSKTCRVRLLRQTVSDWTSCRD